MASGQPNQAIRHLCRTMLLRDEAGLTDGQLLERFVTRRDERAFEDLVRRHGPMVLGVCRRVLRNEADAEDAFQATFLVLVRKAASVVPREMVASWLYGVACQTARRARVAAAKRQVRERQVAVLPEPEAARPDSWDDLRPLLDQELRCLPDKYRAPVVLCDLEGKTHQEAAGQLGWPIGTVSGRLARARKLLAGRLARRGLALSAGSLPAVLLQNGAAASVPPSLVAATVKAAGIVAAGPTAGGVIPTQVAALTEGVLRAMFLSKLKVAASVLLAVGILGAGLGTSGLIDRTTAVEQGRAGETAEAPGQVGKKVTPAGPGKVDERKLARITARTPGMIEKIYKATGERVKNGEPLAELHSPELTVVVQEFLDARRTGRGDLERLARERLQLRGVDDDQIDEVLKSGKPVSRLTIRSPLDGQVIRVHRIKGDHVKEGDPLYDLAELPAADLPEKQATQPAVGGPRVQALLKERLATLKQLVTVTRTAYVAGKATFAELAQATAQLLQAELELCQSDKERLAVHEKAVALATAHEKNAAQLFQTGKATQASVLAARANRLEAEIAFERAKARVAASPR